MASSHASFLSARATPKPPISVSVAPSPVPNSTRPPEMMSRLATRSATRAGWLIAGGIWMIPWPRRICFVRAAAAARTTSGAALWQYSSRKWCSVRNT